MKLLLSITDASQDAILDRLVGGASDDIATHCGRTFLLQKYQESDPQTFDADCERLYLSQFPIDRDRVTVTIDGVAVTDFEVEEAATGLLFRENGWPETGLEITYFAGYVSPDQARTWSNGMTVTLGHFVKPSAAAAFTAPLIFEATTVTGGSAAAAGSEPTWPTTAGTPVASGSNVTFTAREVEEVPLALQDITYLEVKTRNDRRQRMDGLRGMTAESYSEEYGVEAAASELAPAVLRSLDLWKHGR